jgi:alginate O-acetyltransferase complex protein AlgJ
MIHALNVSKLLYCALLIGTLGMSTVRGEETEGIVGKNEWLFNKYEVLRSTDAAGTAQSIELIGRFNRVLKANGVSLAVTMVPLKMRIYSEYLPDSVNLSDFMATNYEQIGKALQAGGVTFIDLNTPFLSSPKRKSDTPLFFRLDSHWSFTGSMLGAQTIKAGIDANKVLKGALDATPEVVYRMSDGKRKLPSKARNLLAVLPRNSGPFAPEQFTPVSVTRAQAMSEDSRLSIGVTAAGSSSSKEWTGFVDALRYVLQRDIENVSVTGDIGPWVGMESYLRSDAFQANSPKLLIWEWAEATMRAPPDYQFQAARYVSNNTEWLLRASAWVQAACKSSTVTARLARVGLVANGVNMKGGDVVTGPTKENEFIEIAFDKPIEKLDYLAARVVTAGSKNLILEGMGSGTATRRFTMNVPGDDAIHMLKTPLPSNGGGFSKVRIYPGKSDGFTLKDLQICRQPEDLLK